MQVNVTERRFTKVLSMQLNRVGKVRFSQVLADRSYRRVLTRQFERLNEAIEYRYSQIDSCSSM